MRQGTLRIVISLLLSLAPCLGQVVIESGVTVQPGARLRGPAVPSYQTPRLVQVAWGAKEALFSKAQTAGNLNLVIIGWNDTTRSITGVTDLAGNTYSQAAPTASGIGLRQAIWYAKNIKAASAGANWVNVAWDGTPTVPDTRILEFAGLDKTTPFDDGNCSPHCYASGAGTFTAGGNQTVSTSNITTTTNALLVAGGMASYAYRCTDANSCTDYVGPNFSPAIYFPATGNIAEFRLTLTAADYAASAVLLNVSQNWLLSTAAFLPAGQIQGPPGPTVTAISPTSGTYAGGTVLTITGHDFAAGAVVNIGGTAATAVTVVSSTQITVTTPAHSAGAVDVQVVNSDGQSGTLGGGFTYLPPAIVTVNLSLAGAGTGAVTSAPSGLNCPGICSHTFDSSAGPIVLTAGAFSGSKFTSWSGSISGTTGSISVPLDGDKNIIATFDLITSNVYQYWVSPTGSDSYSESQARNNSAYPFKTLWGADSKVLIGPNGSIVTFRAGTYNWPSYVYVNHRHSGIAANRRLTYQSETPQAAKWTFTCGQPTCMVYTEDYVDWIGFEISGNGTSGGPQVGLDWGESTVSGCNAAGLDTPAGCQYATYFQVLNNYFHDFVTASCSGGVALGISGGSHNDLIQGNLIRRAGYSTSGPSNCIDGYGLYLGGYRSLAFNNVIVDTNIAVHMYHDSCENVIANNVLAHSNTSGMVIGGTNDTIAAYCWSGRTGDDYNAILNNVFVRNAWGCGARGHGAYMIHVYNTGSSATHNVIKHNYFADNFNASCAVSNSITVDGSGAITTANNTDAGSNYGNLFVNYLDDGTGDYHEANSSPLINAGTEDTIYHCAPATRGVNPCVPTLDKNGTSRPQGLSFDIGAYER